MTANRPAPTHCQQCRDEFAYVFVHTEDGHYLCIDCFEIAYPRMAGANRIKGSGQQLELPLNYTNPKTDGNTGA